MIRLTRAHRVKIFELFYRNNKSLRTLYRLLRKVYSRVDPPTVQTIRNVVPNLRKLGVLEIR